MLFYIYHKMQQDNIHQTWQTIDTTLLVPHFPYQQLFDTLGFAMPYPEVLMTSDKAYALMNQLSSMLMQLGWDSKSSITYRRLDSENDPPSYEINLQLSPEVMETWGTIELTPQEVEQYLRAATLRYLYDTKP